VRGGLRCARRSPLAWRTRAGDAHVVIWRVPAACARVAGPTVVVACCVLPKSTSRAAKQAVCWGSEFTRRSGQRTAFVARDRPVPRWSGPRAPLGAGLPPAATLARTAELKTLCGLQRLPCLGSNPTASKIVGLNARGQGAALQRCVGVFSCEGRWRNAASSYWGAQASRHAWHGVSEGGGLFSWRRRVEVWTARFL
jgi:hypothetical protein